MARRHYGPSVGRVRPNTSFGTTRRFNADGSHVDTHVRDLADPDLLTPPPPATEETAMPPTSRTSPTPASTVTAGPAPEAPKKTDALAVPSGLPLSSEEWADLSPEQRQEAMALYAAETQETVRDLAIEFPKITVPTGAGLFWTLPNGEPVKEFGGVVVAHFKARAYWPLDAPIANNPPTCSSIDGRYPLSGAGPTGASQCAACPYSKYGSGKEGRGQACKERMNTFLLMEDSDLPRLLSLPPTSIKPFSRYARGLIDQKPVRPLSSLVTIFGLEKKTGGVGPDYSVVAPRPSAESLMYAEVRAVIAMREKFQEAMSRRGITEAEAVVDDAEETGGGAAGGKGDPGF